jgi:DNA-binding MarR family transcriptional regulator
MTDAAHATLPAQAHPAASARRRPLAEQSSELRVAVMRLSRRLRQERTETELSASQFSTLAWISAEGPLTIGRLADLERVTAPSMNRTVNCLADAGYVTRAASPDDGRKVLVSTTEAGEAVIRETRRRRDAWLAKHFATLTPAERDTLAEATAILRRIIDQ